MAVQLPPVYDPAEVEERRYQFWQEGNYFHARRDEGKETFTIVIPPPNVTGQLHIGHALDNTIQDILVRRRRMQGYDTLWIPGSDHAGIATQAKVEAKLAEEGKRRCDIGREDFLKLAWEWKDVYHERITRQLKKLGVSVDWSRERFTLDEGCSRSVREVFVSLYEKGLIYRGDYMVNWCPRCNTALSDIEVEHEEKEGTLTFIRYPLTDGEGFVTVATTRPETMLGDTAVAVHPDDERYRNLAGKKVKLPLVNRAIPIVADEYVDPEFGTGAVKITPAHDPNDFAVAERHNLESIRVIANDGRMTEAAGSSFSGLDRSECRDKIIAALEKGGYIDHIEPYMHSVGQCSRCHTDVEPLVSRQWFVKMKPLAEPAIKAVRDGKVRFVPRRFSRVYLNWMENVRDWCISRQIWWGHRIPAWYCECGKMIVCREDPVKCPYCGSSKLVQDEDVLDTWFSSALWPFSTLGWPDETPDLKHFFPTDVLVTGYDIIYFWVARMIVTSLEFMHQVPFKDVYIHGLVRDSKGRKMSKSLGNGVDPLEEIDNYGADTLRFALITAQAPGNDQRYRAEGVESSRNFANKIWNASRFVLMNLGGFQGKRELPQELTLPDRWILHSYNTCVQRVDSLLEAYELGEAAHALYEFIWNYYCDWYIEFSKLSLYGGYEDQAERTKAVLVYVLDGILRLLHPFMPFITEEIWQHLPHGDQCPSLIIAEWPRPLEELHSAEAAEEMETVMDIIKSVRNLRNEMKIPPTRRVEVIIKVPDEAWIDIIQSSESYFARLAGVEKLSLRGENGRKPRQAIAALVGTLEVYLPLAGLVDLQDELKRAAKEIKAIEAELLRSQQKLSNKGFLDKAPAEVVKAEHKKRDLLILQKEKLSERQKELQE